VDGLEPAARLDVVAGDAELIEGLRDLIRQQHGCESRWLESVDLGRPAHAKRTIQVFELLDHPRATRAYGWRDGWIGEVVFPRNPQPIVPELVVVLGIGPVVDAQTALFTTTRAKIRAQSDWVFEQLARRERN